MYNDNVVEHPRNGLLMPYGEATVRLFRKLSGKTGRKGMLSLFDQGLVSGANFFTSVIIGRFGGPAELGLYFLGFTLITLLTTAQISLISVPHTIYLQRRKDGDRSSFDGSVLAHQMLLSLVLVVVLASVSLGLFAWGAQPGAAAVAAVLAIGIPFVLLREFARRYCFAHMKVSGGLVIDFITVVLQVAILLLLSQTGRLTAVTALATLGGSCAVSSLGWLWVSRGQFQVELGQALRDLGHNFSLAKWVFASECGASLLTLSGPWLTATMLGKAEAGVYAACLTLAQAVNPLLFGTYNVLAPRAAQAFVAGGVQEVRRVILTVMAVIGCGLLVWCGFLFVLGEPIIAALYGDRFKDPVWIVFVLSAAVMVRSLGMVSAQGLQTIERPEFGLWSNMVSLVILIGCAPVLIPRWGVIGAASSIFVANTVGFLIRITAFSVLSRPAIPEPEGALT